MTEAVPAEPVVEPVAAPVAAEPAPASLAAPEPATPEPAEVKGDWPDDWREKLSGGDEKELARLKRFASPANVLKSYRSLEQRISAGELREPFPADGKPEDQAKWREANGIPESPDKYELSLPDGLTVGEADKPILEQVKKAAHAVNAPASVVNAMTAAYYQAQDELAAQQAEQAAAWKEETEEVLRTEYGPDFKRNLAAAENYLSRLPDGLGPRIAHAVLSDGRPLGADPVAVQWLVQMAHESNPLSSLMPGGADSPAGIDAELADLRKVMKEQPEVWYKDAAKQERFQKLTEAKSRMGGKAA